MPRVGFVCRLRIWCQDENGKWHRCLYEISQRPPSKHGGPIIKRIEDA